MLYHKNNNYHLPKHKVFYTDNGDQLENYVGSEGKKWWTELTKIHDGIKITKFEELTYTDEQKGRLEEVNQLNVPDGFSTVVADYVLDNQFSEQPNHVLKDLENKIRRELDNDYLIDLDFRMSMTEMGM